MDASKFIALVLAVAFAGLLRQWWSAFVKREEAKPIELVEVEGVMVPKPSRLDRIRRILHVLTIIWMITVGTLAAVLIIHGPFDQ